LYSSAFAISAGSYSSSVGGSGPIATPGSAALDSSLFESFPSELASVPAVVESFDLSDAPLETVALVSNTS
tara:strand:- start:311 stop:523 length:213 start_codon:yes stop_codon:yes gene_type:complete